MIRLANPQDLDAVAASYDALLLHEQARGGHTNWVLGVYPTRQTAEAALADGALYILEEEGSLCASMILNRAQAADYARIPWQFDAPPQQVAVLHTLCVPPDRAKRGYGRRMVEFALAQARAQGCAVLRLDTFAGNAPAAALYEKLGFRLAGRAEVLHQGVIREELIFFEKRL